MHSAVTGLLKPQLVEVVSKSPNHSRIVIEPLERGFGHSLGNALRRVLLSSIPGCAVVSAEIDNAEHEYSVIDGVQEDVIDILLNLKQLAVVLHSGNEVTLSLSKSGLGPVTAADIQLPHDVEIINPDLVIANLTEEGALSMKINIQRGRGYEPSNTRTEGLGVDVVGALQVDASYTPINKVAYKVESTRVEQRTNLDKLIIELETNGTVDPESTIKLAATILHDQLSVFVDFEKVNDQVDEVVV
ncbi:MAG: DNA-directed RNA polymerase subunit alpha, partial [Methyloprofundus sp.]|nr:DNA-directed RNA polymerase subunit alpha [Methyloprofundus sp.]